MSKKEIKRYRSYGPGYVIHEEMPNHLVGRLCTLVDALGLKDSQEKSLKDLIRQEVWTQFDHDKYTTTVWIPSELNNEVHYVLEDIKKEIKEMEFGGTNSDAPRIKGETPWLQDYQYDLSYKLKN